MSRKYLKDTEKSRQEATENEIERRKNVVGRKGIELFDALSIFFDDLSS